MKRKKKIESTAYHEAGHAVAAYHCGADIERVTNRPVGPRKDAETKFLSTGDLRQTIFILWAGWGAEAKYNYPRDVPIALSDFGDMSLITAEMVDLPKTLQGLGNMVDEMDKISTEERDRVVVFLDDPQTWRAVVELAEALIEQGTMQGTDVMEIIGRHIKKGNH